MTNENPAQTNSVILSLSKDQFFRSNKAGETNPSTPSASVDAKIPLPLASPA